MIKLNFEADGRFLLGIVVVVALVIVSFMYFQSPKEININKKQDLEISVK
jgi:hypothetical protein